MNSRDFINYYIGTRPAELGIILNFEKSRIKREIYFMYYPSVNLCGTLDGLISFHELVKRNTSGENTILKYKITQVKVESIKSQEDSKINSKYKEIIKKIVTEVETILSKDTSKLYIPKKGEYIILKRQHKYIITKFGELTDNTEYIFTRGFCFEFADRLSKKMSIPCKTIELKLRFDHSTPDTTYKILKRSEFEKIKETAITLYDHAFCIKKDKAIDINGVVDMDAFIKSWTIQSLDIFHQHIKTYSECKDYCLNVVDYRPEQFEDNKLTEFDYIYIDSIITAFCNMYHHALY